MAESPVSKPAKLSFFENGRVLPETIDALFQSARMVFAAAPWKTTSDAQVLRLDIPALDVEGDDVLLKDMEHYEARIPEAQRSDFSGTRRELGLD